MERYFAFIRAINTGGRRLSNEQVLAPFVELGLHEVAAYQAAGNVTFVTDDAALADPELLSSALARAYGFEAPTFVRTATELGEVVSARPFTDGELAGSDGRVQVTFLGREPDSAAVAAVAELVPAEDRVVLMGREWFWLPVRAVSESGLPVGRIERVVGPMTMRTLGTVTRMWGRWAADDDRGRRP